MKAKYILRGLGLGMIITAVVMGAYTRSAVAAARVDVLKEYGIGDEAMLAETGDEVMLAETLVDVGGDTDIETQESELPVSVESEPAAETVAVQENSEPETVSAEETAEPETVSTEETAEPETEKAQSESTEQVQVSEADEDASDVQLGTVAITIAKGDDSGTVARKLYNAGLVENAAEYDAFLMQHGYDKKLNTGEKIINVNDTWQEIAEKLTR